jgi:hypothetical protein
LLDLEDTLKPSVLTYDIWEQLVVALEDARRGQELVIHPLHTLPMQGLQEVKDTHDLLIFGDEEGYCSRIESQCECDMEFGLPCMIVQSIMHGVL